MRTGVLARKIGMTRVYNTNREHNSVTVLQLPSSVVIYQYCLVVATIQIRGGERSLEITVQELHRIRCSMKLSFVRFATRLPEQACLTLYWRANMTRNAIMPQNRSESVVGCVTVSRMKE